MQGLSPARLAVGVAVIVLMTSAVMVPRAMASFPEGAAPALAPESLIVLRGHPAERIVTATPAVSVRSSRLVAQRKIVVRRTKIEPHLISVALDGTTKQSFGFARAASREEREQPGDVDPSVGGQRPGILIVRAAAASFLPLP